MEVRIGVINVAREVVFESTQSPQEVADAVAGSLTSGSALDLTDDRGHRVIVPADRIGYIDIGAEQKGRVGFGG